VERRMMIKHAFSLVAFLGFAALGLADAKEDGKAIQGTWVPISAELGTEKLPEEALKDMKLTLTDGKYSVEFGKMLDKGTFTLDPGKKPASMDIEGTEGPNKGKTFPAIYELSGDSLKVCYDLAGKARPTEFKTMPKTMTFLVVYKRVKP
jgi:uncharacterized protein (TIGR03067 family)